MFPKFSFIFQMLNIFLNDFWHLQSNFRSFTYYNLGPTCAVPSKSSLIMDLSMESSKS